jgi:hypothetical protein
MVFSGLLVAILVAAPVLAAESPLPVSTTVSAVSSTPAEVPAATPSALVTVDISDGWRFRTDPRRTGTGGRWDAPTANDSRWTVADASGPWERYAPGYVGVAWYRRWVDCPPVAERAFLIVEGLAARADLFVDGWPMGKEVRGPRSVRELTSRVRGKARFLLALKVTGPARGGIAGLTGSVKLATGGVSRPLFPDLPSWIRFLAGEFPGMPWPGWARELSPEASPMGDPALAGNGWLGRHGEFSPADGRFAVSCWLYDRPGKRLYAPEFTAGPLALMDKVMPVPIARAGAGRFALQASYWAEPVPGRPGVAMAFGQATVQNNSDRYREAELVIAVHPFSPRCGGVCAVKSVAWDKTTQCILVNGIPAVVLAGSPDGVGAAVFAEEDTIARFVARGELPSADRAEDPEGLASAAAVYRLNIQPFGARTQTFRVLLDAVPGPLDPAVSQSMRDLGLKSSLKDTRDRWSRLLYGRERPRLRIREQQAQNCWYASVGAILASLGREMHPTDRAMTVAALLRAGLPDEAGVALKRLEKEAFSPSGSPTARIAWVWAASSMVRFSRVEVPFGAEWPAVSRACRDAAGMASSPSASADDLAWSARALAEGAWAARLLGKGEDASWMRTSGETAVQALTQRLTADPRSWLGLPWPGASLVTGAFASSTAVLDEWSPPVRPRRPGAPAPAPSDTRFRPPAVLAYAHSAVLALRSDLAGRALLASVSRYSVPGAYAWADESGGGLPPAGENPSIRAAAEYACLIRDAIVREEGDSLLLATGIPEQFTTPGFMLDIRYVPTTFGVFAGYSLTISPLSMELRIFKANEPARRGRSIQVREGDEADPPGGLKWHVPGTRRIRRLVVDGRLAHEVPSDRWINIDRDTRRVSVIW